LISAHTNISAANDNCGYMSLVIPFLTKLLRCCRYVKIVDDCCCFCTYKYLQNTFHSTLVIRILFQWNDTRTKQPHSIFNDIKRIVYFENVKKLIFKPWRFIRSSDEFHGNDLLESLLKQAAVNIEIFERKLEKYWLQRD
ncbi:unnamed protein product, partial [Didymodactylos carnosus]